MRTMPALLAIGLALTAIHTAAADREGIYTRYLDFPSLIRGGAVEPHWMASTKSG